MKPLEIKGARARLGLKQRHMAELIGIPVSSYCNKENGVVKFTDEERARLAEVFGWTPEQINDYLFDGKLPIGSERLTQ